MNSTKVKEDYCLKYGHPTRSHECIKGIESLKAICLACKNGRNVIKGV